MKQKKIGWIALMMAICILFGCIFTVGAEEDRAPNEDRVPETEQATLSDMGVEEGSLKLPCKSAILMEATTGSILYAQNAEEALPPASVTKIMTLLLVMEAVDDGMVRLDDTVTVSETAASMGGSQVYLKVGEQMKLEDLLKSVVIASANDAAVALAEHLCGSVPIFVEKMNVKARQLGMENTVFENVTGLDDTAESHLTSAHDIALMSKELLRHPTILQYSSIWMDTIRDGAFGLTNTNRLVRFYQGCTGLKTGSTSKAGFCVSVSAERNGFSLICVIMGAESSDVRNATATSLLDWGFAGYGLYQSPTSEIDPLKVVGGKQESCRIAYPSFSCVLPKNEIGKVTVQTVLPESIQAPVQTGDAIGEAQFFVGEKKIGAVSVTALETVEKISFFDVLFRIFAKFLMI